MIALICREFGVNETWLRTGQGEMFLPKAKSDEIDAFMKEILRHREEVRQMSEPRPNRMFIIGMTQDDAVTEIVSAGDNRETARAASKQ